MPEENWQKIDLWEAIIANIKEHKWTLIILLLVILLPYLLYGGKAIIGANIPFWKILDIFMAGMKSGMSSNLLNSTATWMPPVITSLIKFIAYFIALILDFVIWIKMFKLIWPKS